MEARGTQSITWDVENRPVAVSDNGTTIAEFVYDGDGNRVKKTENGQTILYINKYYEKNLDTGGETSYYYLGDRLVAMSENTTLRYVHQDHLSGTSLMTDTNGDQIDTTMKYYPYGGTRAGDVPTDKKFTGQRLDDTGLYYYGARYYDPLIGRFISADTIVPNPANPQSFNRYSYCLNNPLKYTDPSGHIVRLSTPEISRAWFMFADICPNIAQMLVESDIVFTIQWGDAGDAIAYTKATGVTLDEQGYVEEVTKVEVILDKGKIGPHREGIKGISYAMSNEIVSCVAYALDPSWVLPTLYEETISFHFQNKYGKMIDYEPTHKFWEYLWWRTPIQRGHKLAETATDEIYLTPQHSQELHEQLKRFYRDTTYWEGVLEGWLTGYYDIPRYWSLMSDLQNLLLE